VYARHYDAAGYGQTYEVIYETQHAGTVSERVGARIRLLEAAIVFAQRAKPGSSG
jgi:hypothetical protein